MGFNDLCYRWRHRKWEDCTSQIWCPLQFKYVWTRACLRILLRNRFETLGKNKPRPQLLKCFCLGCWEIWDNLISQKKELQSIMKPTVHLSFPVTNTPKHFVDSLFCYFALKYLLYPWWVSADQRSVPATFVCRNGCWVWPTCSISKDSQPSCMDPFDSTLPRMMII